jgi:hypothetical protein
MSAYGATLSRGEHEAGTRGFHECRGYWEGSHRELAHITLLELTTVGLALKEILEYCVLRENEVVKLYPDNMVVMYVVNQWVSKSPAIMAELRRLHQLCKCHGLVLDLHHLPSALNLFANRLSRRRRVADYLPSLTGVPGHWWVGDSEHDLKLDRFQGLMLVPFWEKQNWYHQLRQMSLLSWDILPDPQVTGKRWRATMLALSLAAISLAEKLGWQRGESSERPLLRSNLSRAYPGTRKPKSYGHRSRIDRRRLL